MIYIGNHVSVTDGYEAMGRHEIELGGDTFAFFPRNPRGGRSKEVMPEDIAALKALIAQNNFGPLVVHGAYTMNLCSAKEEVRNNSFEMMRDDLIKLQQLPGNFYNFHPGSHIGQGAETGIEQIASALVRVIRAVEEETVSEQIAENSRQEINKTEKSSGCELKTIILLETMTGKGSEMGGSFEELRAIIDKAAEIADSHDRKDRKEAEVFAAADTIITDEIMTAASSASIPEPVCAAKIGHLSGEYIRSKLGVCLDTCHVWDAGYDIVNNLDGVLAEFDRVIGLEKLYAVHINDSKNECGARKDRHEKLGLGKIGEEALRRVVQHPLLQGLPFILETPNEDDGYKREIAAVREWME